jgi:hypothetical protein
MRFLVSSALSRIRLPIGAALPMYTSTKAGSKKRVGSEVGDPYPPRAASVQVNRSILPTKFNAQHP